MNSTHHERPRGVVRLCQIAEYPVSSESSQASDILNEHPIGSALTHNAEHFEPQPGSLAREPWRFGRSSCADVLAREPAADDVDPTQSTCVKRADVFEDRDARPVMCED